jgi:hypothetical protein
MEDTIYDACLSAFIVNSPKEHIAQDIGNTFGIPKNESLRQATGLYQP